jgi:hypothetical protein
MLLREKILELKQACAGLTFNPILFAISLEECETIDKKAESDQFVESQRREILGLLKDYRVGYEPQLENAFAVYSQVAAYLQIRGRGVELNRVKETDDPSPDFSFLWEQRGYFMELKTPQFVDSPCSYKRLLEKGLEAAVSNEAKIRSGRNVAISELVVSPLQRPQPPNDTSSTRFQIEMLINKIEQNLKEDQFGQARTLLAVDLSLLQFPSGCKKPCLCVYPSSNSMVTGVLWATTFAERGDLILSPIEFEGKPNVDGRLASSGVLVNHQWIKAILFRTVSLNGKRSISFLIRHADEDELGTLAAKVSDFWNDDMNSNAWQVLPTVDRNQKDIMSTDQRE